MRFIDAATAKLAREIKLPRGAGALCVAVSADGRLVAVGDNRGTVSVWEAATGKLEREIKPDARAVNAVAFTDDGKAIAAGGDEGMARVWRLDAAASGAGGAVESKTESAVELKVGGAVVSLLFVPDGQLLAVGALNHKEPQTSGTTVWRWQTKERVRLRRSARSVRSRPRRTGVCRRAV